MSLVDPKGREEDAVAIFYRSLIRYLVEQIRQFLLRTESLPEFPGPVDLVCAGGTSMVNGFIEVFRQEMSRVQLPITIGEIRAAQDQLNATARGCLLAAMSSV